MLLYTLGLMLSPVIIAYYSIHGPEWYVENWWIGSCFTIINVLGITSSVSEEKEKEE